MRGSKSSISGLQLGSYLLTFVLGVGLAFSTLRVLSSEASPPATASNSPVSSSLVALQPSPAPIQAGSFVASAVEQVGPAVVRIDTERTVTRQMDPLFEDPFFRRFFGDQMIPQVPQQELQRGQGSGFIIDREGIVLTNAHVVSQADKVTVTLKDGRTFEGEVAGIDEVIDLAVVKINPRGENLPLAKLGDSSNIRVGDWAIAVGNPLGLNNTVTLGIISTLSRSSAEAGIPDKRIDFIQTDAAINPGNSGGPLLNERGEVIGINTAIRADANGIGFAIPINQAKDVKDILAKGGEVPHPYVGIQMVTLTPELAKQNNNDPNSTIFLPETNGVLVMRVMPNTPAEAAGIRRGDVITKVENKAVSTAAQLQEIVARSNVNQSLRFEIQRGSQSLTLTVRTAQLRNAS
ncbi:MULTISPECIES: HhoA/HhoB/HtrA family serine endopeptidase [Planktothricoides]|uniref:HhoA/HhoB/HtrA family serine endopeptidase n=2 Tax=Planktothricoides raciborskii TaxID=132608 RepID=A0AAU8JDH4_9CYAN|nr:MULTISPECIES: HhoA/HhoB/HtrA family serine endopeptidase [Planktothricoides]KOR36366.1 serine protease [Planktothricoides sp. SR001]MBD2547215.1 trypsin-like peptidase domain-containing protein [Planktothricoides raciborskii FACHB-1370]MBD2585781.1 trypsin-like peptidase domain-containing protein [Planktothricoides raciborskii FACHB-1261]